MNQTTVEGLEKEFTKAFLYSIGKPAEGSMELTHNNVRAWLHEFVPQILSRAREEQRKKDVEVAHKVKNARLGGTEGEKLYYRMACDDIINALSKEV